MEITEAKARELGIKAGDDNMKLDGRKRWNQEDQATADVMYILFKLVPKTEKENGHETTSQH